MANNILLLNANKSQVLITASNSIASSVAQRITSLSSAIQSNKVIFDQAMYFEQHIKSLTRTCVHLRNIAKLRSVVSQPELDMIIH